jgi:hypothetical protein
MKVIYNNIIPFKGYAAINLFGVVFARKDCKPLKSTTLQHEAIHTAQMKELLYIGFYILYFLEWIYRLIFHTKTAYNGISFEVEAYKNQWRYKYIETRKHFAMWRKTKA